MDLIILAGGYATRLGDRTKLTPKIMLKLKLIKRYILMLYTTPHKMVFFC